MNFKVRLIPDDYHLKDVGCLDNGTLYWIDVQLCSESGSTRDFVATYVFDQDGRIIWNEIEDLGLRSEKPQKPLKNTIVEHQEKLGAVKRTDIWVYPFSLERHGQVFGLVVREPEEDGDVELLVDAMPGWTLMFYPPWEKGAYDT